MKTLKYLAICAAAFTFAACNVEEPAAPQKDGNFVIANFGAEAVKPLTKATLTPGETYFTAKWSEGDEISIAYANDRGDVGVATGTWNGSSFEAELPDYEGIWSYSAVYPMIGDYDYSISQQNGADYNSINDLMGTVDEIIAVGKPGKDYDRDVVFPMVRNSAILYFHFTSNLEDEVIGATLSTKNGDLAFSNVGIYYSEQYESIEVDQEEAVDNIVLSTSQDATDFTLWFNVEEGDLEDLTLTVATECGKTFTLTRAGEVYYNSGSAYTVDMAIADEKWVDGEDAEPAFVKVTSALTDFSGRYLIVDDDEEGNARAFNGVDAVSDFIEATAVDGVIADDEALVAFDIAAMEGGYSIKVIGGEKDGYYLSGKSGSNSIVYNETPVANEITFEDGKATILSDNTTLRFNATSNQNRFRYYKTTTTGDLYHFVSLYKFNGKIQTIAATGIELDAMTLNLKEGETSTLTATVTPANATNQTVVWTSSDEDVATVAGGKVTAVGEGDAEITATVYGTEISASCTVYVTAASSYSLEDLVENVEPTTDGVEVTVLLDNEPIVDFAYSGSYRNGIFLMAGDKKIEIYCKNVPAEWIVGGTVTGTLNCPWKVYNTTWELCPDSWEDIEYSAPAVIPTYTITIPNSIVNGKVVASATEAKEGDVITITATPDEGYILSSLTAGAPAEKLSGNVLTFTMPGRNITVSAAFAEFSDYADTYTSNVELTTAGGTSASTASVIIDDESYDAIKCGTGKVKGAMQVTVPAGATKLHFHAFGWKGETVTISVAGESFTIASDNGVSNNTPFTLTTAAGSYYSVDVTGGATVTIAATAGNRFVVWGVNAE